MTDKNKFSVPLSEISGCAGRIMRYETEVDKISYDANTSVSMKTQADLDETIRFLNNLTEICKGKILLMIDSEIIRSLKALIDYMYYDEKKHYEECVESDSALTENHIFLHVKNIKEFLDQLEEETRMEDIWNYVKTHIS